MGMCVFFKQKTAYELRISDWSSDVCSSDLRMERTALLSAASCWRERQGHPAPTGERPAIAWPLGESSEPGPGAIDTHPRPRQGAGGRRRRREIGRESWGARVCEYV